MNSSDANGGDHAVAAKNYDSNSRPTGDLRASLCYVGFGTGPLHKNLSVRIKPPYTPILEYFKIVWRQSVFVKVNESSAYTPAIIIMHGHTNLLA